ncbi:MAG: hypothetical protein K8L91_21105 [Anaerolineae bacterium]|nr:hypothetical protein [Anaerolineae bacterium]
MVILNKLQSEIFSLLKAYIERQKIVLAALNDLKPYILPTAQGSKQVKEILDLLEQSKDVPFRGNWGQNNEWFYYIHGYGCRLIHNDNKEPIEWDAPNINSVNVNWFINWLKWFIEMTKIEDPVLSELPKYEFSLDALVYSVLEELKQKNLIFGPDSFGAYIVEYDVID